MISGALPYLRDDLLSPYKADVSWCDAHFGQLKNSNAVVPAALSICWPVVLAPSKQWLASALRLRKFSLLITYLDANLSPCLAVLRTLISVSRALPACRLNWLQGIVVSAAVAGAAVGAAGGGWISDLIGRKVALLVRCLSP